MFIYSYQKESLCCLVVQIEHINLNLNVCQVHLPADLWPVPAAAFILYAPAPKIYCCGDVCLCVEMGVGRGSLLSHEVDGKINGNTIHLYKLYIFIYTWMHHNLPDEKNE